MTRGTAYNTYRRYRECQNKPKPKKVVNIEGVITPEIENEVQQVTADSLPRTQKEYDAWLAKHLTSFEARAMRIYQIILVSQNEAGIARMKALEVLDDLAKQHSELTGEAEPVFFRVLDTKSGKTTEITHSDRGESN